MKKLLKFLSKKTIYLLIIITLTVIVVLSYFKINLLENILVSYYDEQVEFEVYDLEEFHFNHLNRMGAGKIKDERGLNFLSLPQIYCSNKDPKIIEKCNSSLESLFCGWIPPERRAAFEAKSVVFKFYSDDYLSIEIERAANGEKDYWLDEICGTINMKTGEPLYLCDLIKIDDEFINLIKTSGFLKSTRNMLEGGGIENYTYTQEFLDKIDKTTIKENLDKCSEAYSEENFFDKGTFYLKHNRIYFLNIFGGVPVDFLESYIELNDIEQYLKVDKW